MSKVKPSQQRAAATAQQQQQQQSQHAFGGNNTSSIRQIGQQSKYLTHLRKQLIGLRENTGSYGDVQYELENRVEQAKELEMKLLDAEEILSGVAMEKATLSATTTTPPRRPASPDLDCLASSLESLARRIQDMEGVAESQTSVLRAELKRVMEVFEDPNAFLPTPVKTMTMDELLKVSGAATVTPAPKHTRFADEPNQPHTPLQDTTNVYPIRSTHSQIQDAADESELGVFSTEPFVPPSLSASLIRPSTSSSSNSQRRASPSRESAISTLDTFRNEVAHQIYSFRHSREIRESTEEVRRLAKEAQSNTQASMRLSALTEPKRVSTGIKRRVGIMAGSDKSDSEEKTTRTTAGTSRKTKASTTMYNPELYPWSSQLQQIFADRSTTGEAAGDKNLLPPPVVFNGLSQSIPAYLEYQNYLQAQLLAQERERQALEEERLEAEKQTAEETEAEERRRRREMMEAAHQQAMQQAHLQVQLHQAALQRQLLAQQQQLQQQAAMQPLPLPQQSQPFGFPSGSLSSQHHSHSQLPSLDGRPLSHQLLNQNIPQFDAIWEVLPKASRDAGVQAQVHQGASQVVSPRPVIDGVSPSNMQAQVQLPTVARTGAGPPVPPAAAAHDPNALSVLDQAALDVKRHAILKGQGLNSGAALDDLLNVANAAERGGMTSLTNEGDIAITPRVETHPLFTNTPSSHLGAAAGCTNGSLLSLVLQMYDQPSDAQVEQEWRRVMREEEEKEERRRAENGESKQNEEKLDVPMSLEEQMRLEAERNALASSTRSTKSSTSPSRSPSSSPPRKVNQTEVNEAKQFEDEVRKQQQAEAEAARLRESMIASVREAKAKEEADRIAAVAAAEAQVAIEAKQRAEKEASRLAEELHRMREETAKVRADIEADAARKIEQQRREWEMEARAKWQAEKDATSEAARVAAEFVMAKLNMSMSSAASSPPPAPAPVVAALPTPTADSLLPSLSSEVNRLRSLASENEALLAHVREEEAQRYKRELERREEERKQMDAKEEEKQKQYQERKALRDAEDQRRHELEARRDELLQQKLEAEALRMKADIEALRHDFDLKKEKEEQIKIEAARLSRAPISRYQPTDRSMNSESSDEAGTSASSTGSFQGRMFGASETGQLSEGEVDVHGKLLQYGLGIGKKSHHQLGDDLRKSDAGGSGAMSPGAVVSPRHMILQATAQLKAKMKAAKTSSSRSKPTAAFDGASSSRHAAGSSSSVPHPPLSSSSISARAQQRHRTSEERKYEVDTPRDGNDDRVNISSTTPEELAAMLRASRDPAGESMESIDDIGDYDESIQSISNPHRVGSLPLRTQYNIPFNTAISQAHHALASQSASQAPSSRRVIVDGGARASPPLEDLGRLVRESIESVDVMGASSESVGGPFGLGSERSRRPISANSVASVMDEPDPYDLSFNSQASNTGGSTRGTQAEAWLRSLDRR